MNSDSEIDHEYDPCTILFGDVVNRLLHFHFGPSYVKHVILYRVRIICVTDVEREGIGRDVSGNQGRMWKHETYLRERE